MAVRTPKAKPRTVSHARPQRQGARSLDKLPCLKELHQWPQRWMGFPEDIPAGEKIVECFRPFIEHLIQLSLSRKTVCRHVNNLWVLGGEIIRDLNETPSLRKRLIEDLLFETVQEDGPLPYGCDSEQELRSFESTCRKLRRFLEPQPC
jgi:hypothetical protein